jgi:hypothetical protein
MTAIIGPILAMALVAQLQGDTIRGTVVDDQGKPVVGAQVVFFVPHPLDGNANPSEVRTNTNAAGQFRLATPLVGRDFIRRANIWAYQPGGAIAAVPGYRPASALVLPKPETRTITIEAPDGHPVAGARVSPRAVRLGPRDPTIELPDMLATSRAATTGADGKATLDYLAAGHQLVAVRVTAESIGTQDFQLIERPAREGHGAAITLRLKPTSRLTGRVRNRAGESVSGQTIEVWLKGGSWLPANAVGFKNGPIRTAADGSFQTPNNLMVGSSYRVVVRAPGTEPILSDWITMSENPRALLPMIQRPLRTISGRVVDRQGKPAAGIEVFQSGDGPERTATQTDAAGRFALAGFRHDGAVFLFARGDGFRFFGRLIKPGDGDVTVELTRLSERPAHVMRMLSDPIPLEESRALARRLAEPIWEGFDDKSVAAKVLVLRSLATADPFGVLRKMDEVDPAGAGEKWITLARIVPILVPIDPDRAIVAAEQQGSPSGRARLLRQIVDVLPDSQRDRKLALLDRMVTHAKGTTRPRVRLTLIIDVAERWCALGEREKAQKLLAEELREASQVPARPDPVRGHFAAQLARFDLPSALAIARQFPASGTYTANGAIRLIAFHLAVDNPALAEHVLRQVPQEAGNEWFPPIMALKMASIDPARARRLTDESQRYFKHPQAYLFLANGSRSSDPSAAHQAFETAMQGIDRLMKKQPLMLELREVLLPLVEQIDPALVPEYFYRIVASRPSIGNPRSVNESSSALLSALLAWYDREAASVLFEPVRAWMDHASDLELLKSAVEFQAWSIFDPRGAVARLEQVPIAARRNTGAGSAWEQVAELLGLPHEARWHKIWDDSSEMRQFIYPPLW